MNKNIKKLLIKTKKSIFSQQIGNNTSKFKGDGYDFVELREYEDGEDIRKIDWVISAKMQKPFVKVFHTQRELDINIIPILNGSVFFGTSKLKQEVIAEISAIIGYSCVAQGDNYSSYIVNENIILNSKKSKRMLGVDTMVESIYNYDCINKKVDYKEIATQLNINLTKKSILFLIGDFFDYDDIYFKVLSQKHEVIAIIVRDKFEEKPSKMGNVNFTDPSNSKVFEGDLNKTLVTNYEKRVKINDLKLYNSLKKEGIEFIKIYTDENILLKMMKLFR
ncbi:MAG: DUF58 domain-containing protein [Campylobacterota bacterium]|nr:DUF58 domain-containing protein [Campylobacterota bacterium]